MGWNITLWNRILWSIIVFTGLIYIHVYFSSNCSYEISKSANVNYNRLEDFDNFDNVTGTSSGVYIVPNIVHFIRFGKGQVTFLEAVCLFAALKNQKPQKLVIHTDNVEQGGKYWDIVMNHPLSRGVLDVRFMRCPDSIFGHKLSKNYRLWHAGDVARLEVLMAEGGIFLDNDSYIVRSLNAFRRYEMTLGWIEGGGISNQVIIAHKNARFLVEWYNNYKQYNGTSWFYNAGEKPTEILREKPYLIHRVRRLMAEYRPHHLAMIYLAKNKDWTKHYVVHLLARFGWKISWQKNKTDFHPGSFNEKSILQWPYNIKDMAQAVYPYDNHVTNTN